MVSEKILVGSALGIHLRPAGAMCDTAVKFGFTHYIHI